MTGTRRVGWSTGTTVAFAVTFVVVASIVAVSVPAAASDCNTTVGETGIWVRGQSTGGYGSTNSIWVSDHNLAQDCKNFAEYHATSYEGPLNSSHSAEVGWQEYWADSRTHKAFIFWSGYDAIHSDGCDHTNEDPGTCLRVALPSSDQLWRFRVVHNQGTSPPKWKAFYDKGSGMTQVGPNAGMRVDFDTAHAEGEGSGRGYPGTGFHTHQQDLQYKNNDGCTSGCYNNWAGILLDICQIPADWTWHEISNNEYRIVQDNSVTYCT